MSLQLYFVPTLLPRTISRKEWYDLWRWKRVMQQELTVAAWRETAFFREYGHTLTPEQRRDMLDRMVNPPILLGPYMDRQP